MPYTKPTLTEIFNRVRNDIYTNLGLTVQYLRKGFIFALSWTLSGLFNGIYGYLDWILDQLFPDTADTDFVNRWASIKNLTPIEAQKSTGIVEVTGIIASNVAVDTEIIRNDGARFKITTAAILTSSPQDYPVISIDAGVDTVTAAATVMTFVSVPVGIDASVTVEAAGIAGGRDDETTEELRARILSSFRAPPRGGSNYDHETWANEALDVTNTWIHTWDPSVNPYALQKAQVKMYFAMFDTYADGVPLAGDVTILQDYIDARKPAGEHFTATAPVADPVAFTISITPDTANNRTLVTAQLSDLIKRKTQENGTLYLSDIYEAIGRTANLTDWTLTTPSANVVTALGDMHTLGTITFT